MTLARHYVLRANDDFVSPLNQLADQSTDPDTYNEALRQLGRKLGDRMASMVDLTGKTMLVAAGAEDVDSLGRGFIDAAVDHGADVKLACLWMYRTTIHSPEPIEIAQITQEYLDPLPPRVDHFVVLKSIISSSCAVRTSLTRLLGTTEPQRIHVVSPVMLRGARRRLASEFPADLSNRFEYLVLAIDALKDESGNVVPGIGGSVYRRMGFSGQEDKNFHMPELVASRITRRHSPSERPSP